MSADTATLLSLAQRTEQRLQAIFDSPNNIELRELNGLVKVTTMLTRLATLRKTLAQLQNGPKNPPPPDGGGHAAVENEPLVSGQPAPAPDQTALPSTPSASPAPVSPAANTHAAAPGASAAQTDAVRPASPPLPKLADAERMLKQLEREIRAGMKHRSHAKRSPPDPLARSVNRHDLSK